MMMAWLDCWQGCLLSEGGLFGSSFYDDDDDGGWNGDDLWLEAI